MLLLAVMIKRFGPESGIYHAPPDHQGGGEALSGAQVAEQGGQLAVHAAQDHENYVKPNDREIVREIAEGFMRDLYGPERYGPHMKRMRQLYREFGEVNIEENPDHPSVVVDEEAINLHDLVEHGILRPEETARRLKGQPPESDEVGEHAAAIKAKAEQAVNEVQDRVEDRDSAEKAFLFGIDASEWEAQARIWRDGAIERLSELIRDETIDADTAEILRAAIDNDKAYYKKHQIVPDVIEHTLRQNAKHFKNLQLDVISKATLDHNIRGLFHKGLETLDIIQNPPAGNPASTFRDCIEAINFFAPALALFKYKKLANALSGAARKWLFDNEKVNQNAHDQYKHAAKHSGDILGAVEGLRDAYYEGKVIETDARVKLEGSEREKLLTDKYNGVSMVPDGVGISFTVSNEMSPELMLEFARDYQEKLCYSEHFDPGHPLHGHPSIEEVIKKSGYHGVHLTFYYSPNPENSDIVVPFEIQVRTERQSKLKLSGKSSDLIFKSGIEYDEAVHQPLLDRLARRGQAEREMSPGSTVQAIAKMVELSPNIKSVFNKLFRVVKNNNGGTVMLPPELKKIAGEILVDTFKTSNELTVLPSAHVTKTEFMDTLTRFSRDLAQDATVLDAISLIEASSTNVMRGDGETPILVGHLLPTALAAIMLAIQGDKIWYNERLSPDEMISIIATVAILHDYVEDTVAQYAKQGLEVQNQKYKELLASISTDFSPLIMKSVKALTSPFWITDEEERRNAYTAQTAGNEAQDSKSLTPEKMTDEDFEDFAAQEIAMLVKPADRLQNHVTDLVRMAKGKAPKGSELRTDMLDYFKKTDANQAVNFKSDKMPSAYHRSLEIIWQFAKHYGYEAAVIKE